MPRVTVRVSSPIVRSVRVQQLEGMFDVPNALESVHELELEVALDERPWQIGLIVGPSGSGKTTLARELFGAELREGYGWNEERAVVDGFAAELGIREVVGALSSVGFSSPPSWRKPFAVLSNGEKFRANLARALCDPAPLVCVDEFTSVVDRTVARIGSAAVAKAVRKQPGKHFVAVSCHDDIVEWLQPDWVLEPHAGAFTWRELRRRPPVELEIARVSPAAWRIFKAHHYLTAEMNRTATCFGVYYQGRLVAFDAWLPFVGKLKDARKARRGHRTVCLPDYQGLGIGSVLFDTIASMWAGLGYRAFSRTSHPAEVANRQKRGNWRVTRSGFSGRDGGRLDLAHDITRRGTSFEWVGPKMNALEASRLLGTTA